MHQLNNIPKTDPSKNICVIIDKDYMTVVNDFKPPKAPNIKDEKEITEIVTTKIKEVAAPFQRVKKFKCQCPDCEKPFKYPYDLYLHLKESINNKRACYLCAKIMLREELITHLSEVHNHKTYDCKKCTLMFRSRKMLVRHMAQAHAHAACTCGDCGQSFKSPPAYYAHLSIHAVKTCPGCNKVFLNQTCYYYHVKKCCELDTNKNVHQTKHKVLVEVQNKTSDQINKVGLRGSVNRACICDHCGKKFAGKRFVAAHIQIVHLKNTHRPCQYCGKYLAAAYMGEHLKKHEVETIFNCEYCGIVLKTKNGYTQHIRLHTGEKPYQCPECGEAFAAASRRSAHIKTKHKSDSIILKYKCDKCPAKFSLPYKLRKHVASVHDHPSQVQFSCDICHEKFSSCRSLTNHSRKHQVNVDFKVYSEPVKEELVADKEF